MTVQPTVTYNAPPMYTAPPAPSTPTATISTKAMHESEVEVNDDGEVVEKESKGNENTMVVIIASVAIIALLSAITVGFFYKNANLKNERGDRKHMH
jgi:p-aminobenzoyl-glutamate transporter AbgT